MKGRRISPRIFVGTRRTTTLARGIIAFLVLMLATAAVGQILDGRVKNGTTMKPAAGDDVILFKLSQGMEEAGRTKTDANGNFSFRQPPDGTPHLIRVLHQGVSYHKMAPPATTSVEIAVYDAAKKVEGLTVTADVMRFEVEGNDLKVTRLFAVENNSNPPKTQMNDHNFEFYLPEGALVDQAMARTANGQPVNTNPVPQPDKNRYAFVFPLRPGETQFQIAFHLPYAGQATLNPRSIYRVDHLVAMLPKSMKFSGPPWFQTMADPDQTDALVEVASNAQPRQDLSFNISGSGTLPVRGENTGGAGGGRASGDTRPGGGLGAPSDAPDPLEKYRWYILGGFGAVLVIGAFYVAKRPQAAAFGPRRGPLREEEAAEMSRDSAASAAAPASPPTSGVLLEALKEELFQLEIERQQGKISQPEYEKHKAALDQTLARALKRAGRRT